MNEREQIGLRVPQNVNKQLKELADEIGVSKNDVILLLIHIGLVVRQKGFTVLISGE